jgi:AcrR family transcriptional regulator
MPQSPLTVESAASSRLERKRAKNRDALVAAARRLFTEDGFEATTIAHISEAADLGFGTFYRYFEDKEAALKAVLEDAAGEMDSVVQAEDYAVMPAREALAQLIERFVTVGKRHRDVFALWWELSFRRRTIDLAPERPRPSLPLELRYAVQRIVNRGVANGEFETPDATLASQFVASGLMFVLAPMPQQADEESTVRGLIELAFQTLGIAASPATTNIRRHFDGD